MSMRVAPAARLVESLESRRLLSAAVSGGEDLSSAGESKLLNDLTLATAEPSSIELAATGTASSLWGRNGELHDPAGRLIDYSYAGYRGGGIALPTRYAATRNARDFGAAGDGVTDDTEAIQSALRAVEADAAAGMQPAALILPAGEYVVKDVLRITQSGVVIKGAGQGETTLRFPRSLTNILGAGSSTSGNSVWGASGGLIWIEGPIRTPEKLAHITFQEQRGDRTISLSSTAGLSVGQRVRLILEDDDDGTLLRHLHDDYMSGGTGLKPEERAFDGFITRIAAINGNSVTLERHLPVDIRPEWQPRIDAFNPELSEIGVEGISMVFPDLRLQPHHSELGYNGIAMSGLADSWIRDVRIHNADSAILIANDCSTITVTDVSLTNFGSGRANGDGYYGHHGMTAEHSSDILYTRFHVQGKWRHAIDVDRAFGTVFSDGGGTDLNMGHHRRAPFSNLFTNLDLGQATVPYLNSGRTDRGPHSAAFSTFWNIRGDRDFGLPTDADMGPSLTFVGVQGAGTIPRGADNWFVERIAPGSLTPQNLHAAQLALRLAKPQVNTAPAVNAGENRTLTLPAAVTFDASVADDELPVGGTLSSTWAKVSGPGVVTFADAGDVDATAGFSAAGTYVLRLSANDGQLWSDDAITVTVYPQAANAPPVANAGPDRVISLPLAASLSGSMSDDGLPSGGLTGSWSRMSGPGMVTFANGSAAATTATFSAAGTYVLRLSVSDGEHTTFDEMTVVANQTLVEPTTRLWLADADTDSVIPGYEDLVGAVTLNLDSLPPRLSIVAATTPTKVGSVRFTYDGAGRTENAVPLALGGDDSGNIRPFTFSLGAHSLQARAFTGRDQTGTGGTPTNVTLNVVRNAPLPGGNLAPQVSAGNNLTVTLPNAGTLNGSVTDDGIPGRALSSTWTKISGPGTVSFANAASPTTAATFSAAGAYLLRLTASDGQLSNSAYVTVTANAPSTATPAMRVWLANADTDEVVPGYENLSGEVTLVLEDLPDRLTIVATPKDSVGSIRFRYDGSTIVENKVPYAIGGDDSGDLDPFAITIGRHELEVRPYSGAKLTGSGGATTAVMLNVVRSAPAPAPEPGPTGPGLNQPPMVSAGPDLSAVLPNTVLLNGATFDDGLPTGALVRAWSKVSGPGEAIFADPTAAVTTAGFSTAGSYVLRLSASDGVLADSDDLTVTVLSAPAANQTIASLSLVNADTDQPVAGYEALTGGVVNVNLTQLPSRLTIRANLSPGKTVGSIKFQYDNTTIIENKAPYVLAGDNSGDYNPFAFTTGSHTLRATPYSGAKASGSAGTSISITLNITRS